MDRGRAGGFITDNNFVGVQMTKKKRKDHLERLNKIMNRKPGSSQTLDNNPPVIIKAALSNPRKIAIRDYFYFVTERENKSLLKRIGSILTAAPKNDIQEYQEMKKRCVTSTRGLKALYEQRVVDKKSQDFFEHLKKVKPYYKAKEWENDYNNQLFNQQFMRQVKYKRPSNFGTTDSIDDSVENADNSSPEHNKSTTQQKKLTSSHIDRVRARIQQKTPNANDKVKVSKCGRNPLKISDTEQSKRSSTAGSNSCYDEEDFDNIDEDDPINENSSVSEFIESTRPPASEMKISLASCERSIKLITQKSSSLSNDPKNGNASFIGDGCMEEVEFIDGFVECYLINRELLVVKVCGVDRGERIENEAEINLADLCSIGDFSVNNHSVNLTMLNDIAQEMSENVEMKKDLQGDIQLVLNLFTENAEADESSNLNVNDFNSFSVQNPSSIIQEEELNEMLLPDGHQKILCCGIKIPVTFLVNTGMHGISNIMLLVDFAKLSQKVEHVYAIVKIYTTIDDQLLVVAHCVSSTVYSYKRAGKAISAVSAGAILTLICPLPSIVQVDSDMILSFAENLSKNLKIEHDCKTGENHFQMV